MRRPPEVPPRLKEDARILLSPLVLASASPNRLALLEECGVAVTAAPQDVIEEREGRSPGDIVRHIAGLKMDSYLGSSGFRADVMALSLDTMVSFRARMLGKPRDLDDARDMLTSFSGEVQDVVTGFHIYMPGHGMLSGASLTKVIFEDLSHEEIDAYLSTGEWQGAAGAYRIQKTGWRLVKAFEGSWTNVIGMPLEDIISTVRPFRA